MNKPESTAKVLDWILEHGRVWFKPRKAVDEIYLNRSLVYMTLKQFCKKQLLIKSVQKVGKQNRIEYKLNEKYLKEILLEIIDSLELILDVVDPYV